MIIDINEELFNKVKQLIKNRSKSIYDELETIKPIETITADTTLQTARAIKTQRIKQSIKETILSLNKQNIKPTKYKINKETNIAYVTINKYYDDIIEEVRNEQ